MIRKLKVLSVDIKDVLGCRELTIEAGSVTVLSGRNGSGKTTGIEALKFVLDGGNLARLARVGDDDEEINPEIVLVLEDEGGKKIRIEKTAKKTRVREQIGETAGLKDVPQPQRWLSGISDRKLSNPIDFLNAGDTDRLLLLLGALPVELDKAKLWADMGLVPFDFPAVPEGLHPLQEIALIREGVFATRTGVNRDAKGKADSAEQLRREIPMEIPGGLEDEIGELESSISSDEERISLAIERAKSACKEQASAMRTAADTDSNIARDMVENELETKRAELEAEFAESKASIERDINEKNEFVQNEIEKSQNACDEKVSLCYDEQAGITTRREQLVRLREQAKIAVKSHALREQADTFEADSDELKDRADLLTGAIVALDKYRREMAEDIPIAGLEIEGREIFVNKIPWAQLNTAQRIKIAVKVSCIRAKDQRLPLVFVDGAEALDSENFDAFCKAMEDEGVQAFAGRVGDGDLAVTK